MGCIQSSESDTFCTFASALLHGSNKDALTHESFERAAMLLARVKKPCYFDGVFARELLRAYEAKYPDVKTALAEQLEYEQLLRSEAKRR